MATSFTFLDDLIRDYFQYRNLTSTSRIFDNEISKLPFGQYRADQIIEQLTLHIHDLEINSLIDYWTQIEQSLLSTLTIDSKQLINVFTKIRNNLYRCYVIHAVQLSKLEKINEFFERLQKTLQQSNEWTKEWFALPFIRHPEENLTFQIYFSKQWNELFWISLQNFLSIAFFHMTPSKICSIEGNNSQQITTKSLPPSSMRLDPSVIRRDRVHVSSTEQPCQSNLTILSKLRANFLPNTKQYQSTVSHDKLPSFSTAPTSIFVQPVQESTIGNQIFLSADDSTTSQTSLLSTRPKSATII